MTDIALADVARLHGVEDIRVAREATVAPGPAEVAIRITAVGLCGSDLHWYRVAGIGDASLTRPLVLGHEFVGVILDGPRAGERVVADPADPCERCESCYAGASNVCLATRFAGFGTTDGALRSVMPWPARLLHRLPDGVGDVEATLLEPLGVALHALDLAPIAVGGRAGVYGCGPLGLLLVQLLRLAGASVIVATDPHPHRVAAARSLGATHGFVVGPNGGKDGSGPSWSAQDEPVDVAFEVAGDDAALSDAIAAIRPRGRVVLVGIPEDDRITFAAGLARRKELILHLARRMTPSDLTRAIALAQAGRVELASLVSHRYRLEEAATAFEVSASREGLKVVIEPTPGAPTGGRP